MKLSRNLRVLTLLLLLPAAMFAGSCQRKHTVGDLAGVWNGTIYLKSGDEVPMSMEIKVDGDRIQAAFVDGEDRTPSTSASFDGRNLHIRFDYYDAELTAGYVRREVIGTITRTWHQKTLTRNFKMWKGGELMVIPAAAEGKDISGEWEMKVGTGDNPKIWRLIVKQKDARLTGTIISTAGDWGIMTGSIAYGKIQLNRFDISNTRLLRAMLRPDDKLEGTIDLGQDDPARKFTATRVPSSDSSHTDPSNQTRVENPAEKLRFGGIGIDGNSVSESDPRFANKVVVLEISGTWCPNCYDEAPLLNTLYQKYQQQGLEIVALNFEYTGNTKRDLEQVSIFARRYDLRYLSLLAGTTEGDDMARKLPQIKNLSAYPTTIFLGRDGRVRKIHSGFEGPATGERFVRLRKEFEDTIVELLGEK